jgi:hypothetical protein
MFVEDLNIFFDLEGFASKHTIDGTPDIVCIVGEKTSGHSELDGTWVSMFEVVVKKADLVTLPEKREKMSFDGVSHTIENIKDDGSVYTITLSTARPGAVLNQI